jgi:hypothetical protein
MYFRKILLIALAGIFTSVQAQLISKTGTTAAPFLEISPGAKSTAMGGAFVSVADDISALWWNPAGMVNLPGGQAVFTHATWLADITYSYGAATFNLGSGAGVMGVGMTFLSMGEMERTTESQPDGTGEYFDAGSFALSVSYARLLTESFSFGGTFKYIQESIFNMTSSAIAFDVGMLYTTPFAGTRLGMSMNNYGGKMQLTGDDTVIPVDVYPDVPGTNEATTAHLSLGEYDLPLIFRVGVSNDVYNTDLYRVTLSLDGVIPNNNLPYANMGGEFGYRNLFFLRGGFRKMFLPNSEGGFTAGGGLDFKVQGFGLALDYGYEDFGRLGNIQKFTMTVKF